MSPSPEECRGALFKGKSVFFKVNGKKFLNFNMVPARSTSPQKRKVLTHSKPIIWTSRSAVKTGGLYARTGRSALRFFLTLQPLKLTSSLMSALVNVLQRYRRIDRNVRNAIAAQFAVQGMNSAFFLLLNYYMTDEGYTDYQVANVLSYRFLAVFLLAFPLGLFIKGRRLKPMFMIAVLGVSFFSHLLVLAIDQGWDFWVNLSAGLWGCAYVFIQITILPFVLLNAPREQHSEAISLSFLSLGGTIFLTGILYTIFARLAPWIDEQSTLQFFATVTLIGVYFVSRIKGKENRGEPIPFKQIRTGYDWGLILRAIIPSMLIAIGAGFTIPVINLFFYHVHGVPSETFSAFGSATWALVIIVMLLMPSIRRRFGYRVAITLFQSCSVVALFGLAATEWLKPWGGAVWLAATFYVIRQPLMSAASPMTSELSMYFVGKRNQEVMAALNASVWSGSWFVSTGIFAFLRRQDWPYSYIFLFTVGLYVVGIAWYAYLIHIYENREIRVR